MWKCNEGRYIQLTLGIWCWPLSENPLPPARQQPGPLTPSTQAIIQEETNQLKKIKLQKDCIVLPWPVYTEPRAKRGTLLTQP